MERERDLDDFETQQAAYEQDAGDWLEERAFGRGADQEAQLRQEIVAASRYASFRLKHPAVCHRCGSNLSVGTKVIGRKLLGRWEFEELGCAVTVGGSPG